MAEAYGVFYMRTVRKQTVRIYKEGTAFTIGKAVTLLEGCDATIIATGQEVIEALRAAEHLAQSGIRVRVVDMFTIKPIDASCVIACAKETGAIVTAENASVFGGLGSAVAEVLAESCPVPMERVGVEDEFGEVGDMDYLKKRFNLTWGTIVEKTIRAIARK
jgi:transketolase